MVRYKTVSKIFRLKLSTHKYIEIRRHTIFPLRTITHHCTFVEEIGCCRRELEIDEEMNTQMQKRAFIALSCRLPEFTVYESGRIKVNVIADDASPPPKWSDCGLSQFRTLTQTDLSRVNATIILKGLMDWIRRQDDEDDLWGIRLHLVDALDAMMSWNGTHGRQQPNQRRSQHIKMIEFALGLKLRLNAPTFTEPSKELVLLVIGIISSGYPITALPQ